MRIGNKLMLILLLSILAVNASAQHISISGYVEDSKTGERLIGATVYITSLAIGTTTNSYGYFKIGTSNIDSVLITARYVGYKPQTKIIQGKNEDILVFRLVQENYIEEVKVNFNQTQRIENQTSISKVEIPMSQIKSLPALIGEADVLRAIQLMPGITSGKEGTSGLYVRGGSPDQNLFIIDDVPLYYVNHLGGFVSTFDPNAINNVTLYKGGFPARYGGRLSSVVDIRLKDGNKYEKKQSMTIGLLSTKYSREGPLKKDTSSYMFSIRRCNVDLVTRALALFDTDFEAMAGYTFYDLNLKYNKKLSSKDRMYISLYGGRDKLFVSAWDNGSEDESEYKYSFDSKIKWGNAMASVRWNHIVNPGVFRNTTVSYTWFFYNNLEHIKEKDRKSGKLTSNNKYIFSSGATDFILKQEYDLFVNAKNRIRTGGALVSHIYNPGITRITDQDISRESIKNDKMVSPEIYLFIEDELTLNDKMSFNLGLRTSYLSFNRSNYAHIEPRFLGRYNFIDKWALKYSYSRMSQPIHLLSSSGLGLPADLWVPSTENIRPEVSDQLTVGLAHTIDKVDLELSIEAYYKELKHLIELKEGVSLFTGNNAWEDRIETDGIGLVKGFEILLQKKEGKTTGWIGYTYTDHIRKFGNINNGNYFPYRYNRKHDISIVLNHKFNQRFALSSTWVYGTGNPVTLSSGKYDVYFPTSNESFLTEEAHVYNGRNGEKMPDYHRLDIAFNFTKQVAKGIRTFSLSIYNAYNRQNAYFLFYKYDPKTDLVKLYQVSLFPIIPSFSYNLKF